MNTTILCGFVTRGVFLVFFSAGVLAVSDSAGQSTAAPVFDVATVKPTNADT